MDRGTDKQVKNIQLALVAAGLDPGPMDGIWGRRTQAAVMEFQRQLGLAVDGIVGADTWAALLQAKPELAGATPFPWLAEATRLLYTREMLGPRSNPDILQWADDLDLHYKGDDVPWCGLFVGHCIGATLPTEVLPNSLLGAQSWIKLGDEVTPRDGAVMVFWRTSRESGLGHVGFYQGEDQSGYYVIGGNQRDSVCYIWMPKKQFLGARWPKTARLLQAQARPLKVVRGQEALMPEKVL